MSEARDATAIDNLEDTSSDFYGGVSSLTELAPHVTVALREGMAVVRACALFVAGLPQFPSAFALGAIEPIPNKIGEVSFQRSL
jgi:hypothetical protein